MVALDVVGRGGEVGGGVRACEDDMGLDGTSGAPVGGWKVESLLVDGAGDT